MLCGGGVGTMTPALSVRSQTSSGLGSITQGCPGLLALGAVTHLLLCAQLPLWTCPSFLDWWLLLLPHSAFTVSLSLPLRDHRGLVGPLLVPHKEPLWG